MRFNLSVNKVSLHIKDCPPRLSLIKMEIGNGLLKVIRFSQTSIGRKIEGGPLNRPRGSKSGRGIRRIQNGEKNRGKIKDCEQSSGASIFSIFFLFAIYFTDFRHFLLVVQQGNEHMHFCT